MNSKHVLVTNMRKTSPAKINMFIFIDRFTRRKRPISLFTLSRSYSAAASATGEATPYSKLHTEYQFKPPISLKPQQNPKVQFNPPARKQSKPPYRPPSSLDRTGLEPVRSSLPFDFRFSYTESSPNVRPIGLREPKYSPFGPGRLDRVWTGVCAPAVDPKVGSAEAEKELEEKRMVWREKIQGEPLSNAERKAIVEKCQKHRTKRQINLGNHFCFVSSVFELIC